MDHVAVGVDEDVSVMSIFNVKQIGEDCIACKRLNKVLLSFVIIIFKILLVESG